MLAPVAQVTIVSNRLIYICSIAGIVATRVHNSKLNGAAYIKSLYIERCCGCYTLKTGACSSSIINIIATLAIPWRQVVQAAIVNN